MSVDKFSRQLSKQQAKAPEKEVLRVEEFDPNVLDASAIQRTPR